MEEIVTKTNSYPKACKYSVPYDDDSRLDDRRLVYDCTIESSQNKKIRVAASQGCMYCIGCCQERGKINQRMVRFSRETLIEA